MDHIFIVYNEKDDKNYIVDGFYSYLASLINKKASVPLETINDEQRKRLLEYLQDYYREEN